MITPTTNVATVSTSRVCNNNNDDDDDTPNRRAPELLRCHDVTLDIMTHPWVSVDTHSTRPHRTNTVDIKYHHCATVTWQRSPLVQNESTNITSRPPQSTSYKSVCSVPSTGC